MAVINGTPASETLPGTAGNDTITGAGGNDKALMGGGNDQFVWNDGDGSDTVEGGTGTDTLDFTGSAGAESLQIGANGPRTQLFRNVGIVAMDLNDVERIELQALGGADTIFVDHLTGTDLKQVVLDLSSGVPGVGDGATDTLFVNGPNGNNILTLTSIGGDISIAGPLRADPRDRWGDDRQLPDLRPGRQRQDQCRALACCCPAARAVWRHRQRCSYRQRPKRRPGGWRGQRHRDGRRRQRSRGPRRRQRPVRLESPAMATTSSTADLGTIPCALPGRQLTRSFAFSRSALTRRSPAISTTPMSGLTRWSASNCARLAERTRSSSAISAAPM